MKKRLPALPSLLIASFILASSAPVLADPAQDQGLPIGGGQQLVPMQPVMATPANYYPAQAGGPPQAYAPQGVPMQTGYPQQYGGQPYPGAGAYPPQGYPQQGAPYQAGVSEAVPGQMQGVPQQQQQAPPQQYQQPPQQYQQPPQQSYQQPSPYEMQEQAIQKGHMQNRSELDRYSPPPEVPDAGPDSGYRGEVSKGPGMKGVVGKAAGILKRTTQVAAPYAASFLVTTAAYKMANRNNGYNRGYGGGYGYGMPMGGYGMPMGGMMPGMGMYGMPGMGMGIPMGMPGF
jgi:hypothetical protein